MFNAAAAKTVISVKQSSRNLLMKFHSEYTSITDELENVCQMIASPTLSHGQDGGHEKQRHLSSDMSHVLSNAEFAAQVERQHLKECEESDYKMLSKLFHDRCTASADPDDAVSNV